MAVGLVLAAQVGSTLHLALVRHAVCLEHGEYVDAISKSDETKLVPAPSETEGVGRGDAATELDGTHDHCVVAAHKRDQQLPSLSLPALSSSEQIRIRISRAGLAPLRTIALYRLVPKQSPPA